VKATRRFTTCSAIQGGADWKKHALNTHPDDIKQDEGIVEELRAGSVRSAFEKRYIRKMVNCSGKSDRGDHSHQEGQPHHYVTWWKDVSERKKAEIALHAAGADLKPRSGQPAVHGPLADVTVR